MQGPRVFSLPRQEALDGVYLQQVGHSLDRSNSND